MLAISLRREGGTVYRTHEAAVWLKAGVAREGAACLPSRNVAAVESLRVGRRFGEAWLRSGRSCRRYIGSGICIRVVAAIGRTTRVARTIVIFFSQHTETTALTCLYSAMISRTVLLFV